MDPFDPLENLSKKFKNDSAAMDFPVGIKIKKDDQWETMTIKAPNKKVLREELEKLYKEQWLEDYAIP